MDVEADEERAGDEDSEGEYDEAHDDGADLQGVVVPDDHLSSDESDQENQVELDAKQKKAAEKKERRKEKRLRMIAADKAGIPPGEEALRKTMVRIDNRAKKRGEKTKRHYVWVTGEFDASKRKQLEEKLSREYGKYDGDTIEHVVHVVFADVAIAISEAKLWRFIADLVLQIGDIVEGAKQEIEKIVFESDLAVMTVVLTVREVMLAIGKFAGKQKADRLLEVFDGFKKLIRSFVIIGPRILESQKVWIEKMITGYWQDDDDKRRLMVFVEQGKGEGMAQKFTAIFTDVARRKLRSFRPATVPENLVTQTTDDILGEGWLPIDWMEWIKKCQRSDPALAAIIGWLEEKELFGENEKVMSLMQKRYGFTRQQVSSWDHTYVLKNEMLYQWYVDSVEGRILVLVVPAGEVPEEWIAELRRDQKNQGKVTIKDWILAEAHLGLPSVHKGRRAMMAHLLCRFAWKGLTRDVRSFVKNCPGCVSKKHRIDKVHNYLTMRGRRPFEKVQIDLQGPIGDSKCEYRYLLTLICTFTNFIYLRALKTKSEDEVSGHLLEIFLEAGMFPRSIQSDLGLEFTGRMIKGAISMMGIRQYLTPAYTPNVNGIVESSHKRVSMALSLLMKQAGSKFQKNWQELIPIVQHHVRSLPIRETGISPFELIYLWKTAYPQDVQKSVEDVLEEENESMEIYLGNKGKMMKEMHELFKSFMKDPNQELMKDWQETAFKKGDLVFYVRPLKETASKFWRGAAGPFRITEIVGRHVVKMEDMEGRANLCFAQPVSVRRLIYYEGNPNTIQSWSGGLNLDQYADEEGYDEL